MPVARHKDVCIDTEPAGDVNRAWTELVAPEGGEFSAFLAE